MLDRGGQIVELLDLARSGERRRLKIARSPAYLSAAHTAYRGGARYALLLRQIHQTFALGSAVNLRNNSVLWWNLRHPLLHEIAAVMAIVTFSAL